MPILKIKGWDTGRNKLAMLEILEETLGLNKRQAKELDESVREGRIIELNFEDTESAEQLAEELIEIGVQAEIETG